MPPPTSTLSAPTTSNKPAFSDADIAQLLLTESRATNELWKTYRGPLGVAGYLNRTAYAGPPQASGLKTNKRFLKSVIRDATDHNRSLLARPARAPSPDPRPVSALRPKRFDDGALVRAELGASLRRAERDGQSKHRSLKDRRAGREGRSAEHGSSRRRRGSQEDSDATNGQDSSLSRHGRACESDQTAHCEASSSAAPVAPSKMDKYFSPSYDPRLDINLDDATDAATGLVAGGNYEEWEAVLVQMRAKREEKARAKEKKLEERLARAQRKLARRERRRRRKEVEKHGGGDSEEERRRRKRKRKERRRGSSSDSAGSVSDDSVASAPRNHATHAQRAARKELGLMDIDGYAKRGKVREWDLGKQNPT